jgi:hypothetical protein
MDPTSPLSPSRVAVDPANIPLPEIPDASHAPSAAVAVLAASSIVPTAEPSTFLVHLRHFATTITNTFFPAPVRQCWIFIYTFLRTKITVYPALYRYGALALTLSVALAEHQQPGFIPRPSQLTNAIIGFLCAIVSVLSKFVLNEYVETSRWPWEDEGWVCVWEKWLLGGTVYDFGASMNGASSPLTTSSTPVQMLSTPTSATPILGQSQNGMPPPTSFKQTIIIPPTLMLSRGTRPPPTPAPVQINKSGIIGESPRPPSFEHFDENAFADRYARLQEVADWHGRIGRGRRVSKDGSLEKKIEMHMERKEKEVDGAGENVVVGKGKAKELVAEVVGDGRRRECSVDLLAVAELIPDN